MRGLARTILIVAVVVSGFGTASAGHCGDAGSPHDEFGSCETKRNEVQCSNSGTNILLGRIYVGTTGVQGCNDGSGAAPVQGRVGVSTQCISGPCLYVDGDQNNTPTVLNGWGRVDATGYHCHDPGHQSYNSGTGRPLDQCLPVQL